MTHKTFKKIAIIGNPGSGKSTLGLKLHKILGLPLYHLDQYFWKPGWVEPDRDEYQKIHNQLCDRPEWIIEGVSTSFFSYRAEKADVIIFLDIPRYISFYRVFKRALTCWGKVYFSSAKGCPERRPDIKFLTFIWKFNRIRKPIIEDLLEKYKDQKKIFVVRNKKELAELIKQFESNSI